MSDRSMTPVRSQRIHAVIALFLLGSLMLAACSSLSDAKSEAQLASEALTKGLAATQAGNPAAPDVPELVDQQPADLEEIGRRDVLGGLIHEYFARAA
jgi:hypothetical protein